MKSNAVKYHLLVSTNDRVSMSVDGFKTGKNDTEKLLRVKLDRKITFHYHFSDIFNKAGRKFSALTGVTPYMIIVKESILINAVFT